MRNISIKVIVKAKIANLEFHEIDININKLLESKDNFNIDNFIVNALESIDLQYCGDKTCCGAKWNKKYKIIKKLEYTDFEDINKTRICEGDIVIEKSYPFYGNAPEITDSNKKCDELNYVGIVCIDKSGWYLDLKMVSNRVRGSAIGMNLEDYNELEIVGNIHANNKFKFKENNE